MVVILFSFSDNHFLLSEQQKEAKSIRCRDRSLRQARRAQLKEKRMNEFKKVIVNVLAVHVYIYVCV